jgi:hypothetical protein
LKSVSRGRSGKKGLQRGRRSEERLKQGKEKKKEKEKEERAFSFYLQSMIWFVF